MLKTVLIFASLVVAALVGRSIWAWEKAQETRSQIKSIEHTVQPGDVRAGMINDGATTTITITGTAR